MAFIGLIITTIALHDFTQRLSEAFAHHAGAATSVFTNNELSEIERTKVAARLLGQSPFQQKQPVLSPEHFVFI